MKNKEKLLKEDSKVYRISQIEDTLYKFINKGGEFDWNFSFKDESQKGKFLEICKQAYIRLNAFEPSEEKYTVPPAIVDAAVGIEKLLPKDKNISNKVLVMAFLKWVTQSLLIKEDVIKSIPKNIVEKIRAINKDTEAKQYEIREKVYKILDEYWDDLKKSIESGKGLVSVAKELGLTRKKLSNYIKAKHPDWKNNIGHKPIEIKNINKVAKKIAQEGMNAAAKEIGCSRSGLYDLMHKQYPEIMAKINNARNNKSQQNLS